MSTCPSVRNGIMEMWIFSAAIQNRLQFFSWKVLCSMSIFSININLWFLFPLSSLSLYFQKALLLMEVVLLVLFSNCVVKQKLFFYFYRRGKVLCCNFIFGIQTRRSRLSIPTNQNNFITIHIPVFLVNCIFKIYLHTVCIYLCIVPYLISINAKKIVLIAACHAVQKKRVDSHILQDEFTIDPLTSKLYLNLIQKNEFY